MIDMVSAIWLESARGRLNDTCIGVVERIICVGVWEE